MAELKGHTYIVTSVAFSPDGKQLASGSGEWCVPVSWMISLPSRNKLNLCLSERIECMFAPTFPAAKLIGHRPSDLRTCVHYFQGLGRKGLGVSWLGIKGKGFKGSGINGQEGVKAQT